MRRALLILIVMTAMLTPFDSYGSEKPVRFSDIRLELEYAIGQLSAHITVFEDILNKMDAVVQS